MDCVLRRPVYRHRLRKRISQTRNGPRAAAGKIIVRKFVGRKRAAARHQLQAIGGETINIIFLFRRIRHLQRHAIQIHRLVQRQWRKIQRHNGYL